MHDGEDEAGLARHLSDLNRANVRTVNVNGFSLDELKAFAKSIGESSFRADQLYRGLYFNRYKDFASFSNFAKELKQKLNEKAVIHSLVKETAVRSADGTVKFVFNAGNDMRIETVWLVSNSDRRTVCISSQAGCRAGCLFCATAKLSFKGSLKVWQIVDQVMQVEKEMGEKCTNIVFMGMGEPMYNYFAVMGAAKIFTDPNGMGMSAKKITISTSGIIPGIRRMIDNKEPYKLAISLNHSDPKKRMDIMPIDKEFPLKELLAIVKEYTQILNKRVTFEYIMMPGVNMGKEHIQQLIKIGNSISCKINLIPLNTTFEGWRRPTDDEIIQFESALRKEGILVFNRQSPGKDINAACGMLALNG